MSYPSDRTEPDDTLSRAEKPQITADTWTCAVCLLVLNSKISICPNDGSTKSVLALSDALSAHYELLEEIGAGGIGRVFKARHRALNQIVAIKILRTSDGDSIAQKRFEQEAKIISTLEHPGIVRVRNFGSEPSKLLYMVLDFVAGQSLAEVLEWQGSLTPVEACDVAVQVCDAMQYAHQRGVFHRDLKPSNIMFERHQEQIKIVILDFGIAKISASSELMNVGLTRTNDMIGSPRYLSPEQATGKSSDARSDIYSLGIILFEMLTGAAPFQSPNAVELISQHLNAPVPTIDADKNDVMARMQTVIGKSLAKKPEDRFQTMQQFKEALLHATSQKNAISEKTPANPTKSKMVINLILLIALGSTCIGCAILFMTNDTERQENGIAIKPIELMSSPVSALHPPPPEGLTVNQGAEKIIQENKNSKTVDFREQALTDEALSSFQNCTKTEEINLKSSRVKGPGLAYLIHLPLRKINFYDSPLDDRGIAEVENMRNLESLDLSYTYITDKGAHHLEKLQKLKRLSLKYCNIGDDGAKSISKLKSLELLNLKANKRLTRKGFELLASMPSLKELRLRDSSMDEAFSGLKGSKQLKVLDIRGSGLSDGTLKNLLGTNIERLNIGHSMVTSEGILQVAKMSKLKFLRPGRHFDNKAVAELHRLRPDIDTEKKNGEDADDF